MNLHGIARRAVNAVNPEITAQWLVNTGWSDGAGARRVPTYATAVPVPAQVQALSAGDLKHPAMQNVQGIMRAVYAYGNIQGVNRERGTGGDLLQFPENTGEANKTWLVVAVLETWLPGWCKVAVQLQVNGP